MVHRFFHTLINHFIPHEGNDYRPHLLQRVALVGMVGLVVLSFTLANFQAFLWQTSDWLVGAVLPAVVVDLTNGERQATALPVLVRNPVLDRAATLKAEDMARYSYFSHESPTGITPWHWFTAVNYPFVHAGENLAIYFTDSSEVVAAWMASPAHRANIVGSQYREIGVGTARGTYNGFETVFVVQLFGTPAVFAPKPITATTRAQLSPATPRPLLVVNDTVDTVASTKNMPQVAGSQNDSMPTDATPIQSDPNPSVTPLSVPTHDTEMPAVYNYVVVTSDLVSTSTNLTPAPWITGAMSAGTTAPLVAKLATQPHTVLQLIYIVLGLLTCLALFASVILEWRHHRPLQTAYGLLLLGVICGLFYIQGIVTAGALIV